MKENFLQKGDIVRCKRWDGSTGAQLDGFGRASFFRVVRTELIRRVSSSEWLAHVIPVDFPETAPIVAHWDRFTKDLQGTVPILPEPDMSLDEIHKAQEMVIRG